MVSARKSLKHFSIYYADFVVEYSVADILITIPIFACYTTKMDKLSSQSGALCLFSFPELTTIALQWLLFCPQKAHILHTRYIKKLK